MEHQRKPIAESHLEHLATSVTPTYDQTLGDGASAVIHGHPGGRPVEVTVFPDTQVARIHSRLHSATIRRAEGEYDEHNHALWIVGAAEDEWVSASIHGNGVVFLASVPSERAMRQDAGSLPESDEHEHEAAAPPPPLREQPRSTPGESPGSGGEKQKALRLTGRVATDPRYYERKTQTGKDPLTVAFQFVVHSEGEPDQYHLVQAYGTQARQLQEEAFLTRGAEVFVVGYPKTFPRLRQGQTTTEQAGLNATVIKPAKRKENSEGDAKRPSE